MITPRTAIVGIGVAFFAAAISYRVRSQQSREPLDRTKEGWPILIGLRLAGLASLVLTAMLLLNPAQFPWAALTLSPGAVWTGVVAFAVTDLWLLWMFHSLGLNLTDTVVTRANATFVDSGPYRYVRNPMYTGVMMMGISLGLALQTWILPLGFATVFTFMAIRTRIEERYLIDAFGDRYREYMKRTGRFLP
ncbi:MAG TPA: isoprenylcysteine carboxylmethyltransferase family protein [Bryobacteraceae bacterium]|nr:isoprenylcysteine carboxylmethyltransferase family protein [Bryobacteraceae bacterium]